MRSSRLLLATVMVALAGAVPAAAQYVAPFHIIPVVVKAHGAAGTDWKSDLAITNLSDHQVTVGAQFFREKHNNVFNGSFSKSFNMAANQTKLVKDVLGTWFPSEGDTKGMLMLMITSQGNDTDRLAVSSRAYNAANPSATYGQTVSSNFLGFVFGAAKAVIPGVRQDSSFRTNIGVVNLSISPAPVQITTYGPGGNQMAQVVKTVESFSLRQWSLSDLGVPAVTGGYVLVEIDPSSGYDPCAGFGYGFTNTMLLTYFSKVENHTGDAEFGYGELDWATYGAECGNTPVDNCGGTGLSRATTLRDELLENRSSTLVPGLR